MKDTYLKAMRLFFLLVLISGIGSVGSGFMTDDTMLWYHYLNKSALTPPNIVFPIVWGILYVLLAVSAFLVWGKTSPRVFVFALACILAWPFSFFYFRAVGFSILVILLLIALLAICFKKFHPLNRWAAYLLIPVLAWCVFALYLNIFIWLNN
ncbi:MAG: tryptophan-rich sensory protein [Lactobacillales bacterium]|jgi:tryptophan-rich sensory protein|nr:tryptophan-rich sensory protein [Lactobacillales bacterium]